MSLKTFNELLSRTLNTFKNQNNNIYITGDFNVNTLYSVKGSLATQESKTIVSSHCLHPLINIPEIGENMTLVYYAQVSLTTMQFFV